MSLVDMDFGFSTLGFRYVLGFLGCFLVGGSLFLDMWCSFCSSVADGNVLYDRFQVAICDSLVL